MNSFLFAMLVVNVPLFLLTSQLMLFHAFLRWRNMTTYEYISMKRREKEKAKTADAKGKEEDADKKRFVLPCCLDWIVYKSRRKRRISDAKIEKKVKKSKSEDKQKNKEEAEIEQKPLKDNPDSPGPAEEDVRV